MKFKRLNSIEQFNKINRESFDAIIQQPKYIKLDTANPMYLNIPNENILPSLNHFGAGNSDDDRMFQEFFNQF